jgi:hypothetical protein
VVFITILKLAKSGADLDFSNILMLFGQRPRRALLKLLIGYIGYKLICSIDNDQVEVLITLSLWDLYTFPLYSCIRASRYGSAGLMEAKVKRNV